MTMEATEGDRRLSNIVQFGTVEEVDYASGTARVRMGDVVTAPLPMVALRAGGNRSWAPYEIGEQVCLLAPSGNLSGGVIFGALFSEAAPANGASADLHRTTYANGAVIEYDRAANHFRMHLAGGSVEISAPGGLSITGTVTVAGDVIADGISLKTHKHGGVSPGGALTGVPA
jgi:phage baseplate assembly protein V